MTEINQTTTILEGRVHEAVKMLEKFERKARRYGVPFSFTLGPVYKETRREQTDNMWYPGGVREYKVNVRDVTITGEQPVVGDYEFLASIEFTPSGNFVDMVPGVALNPSYRTTDQRCEHCHTQRRRKNVYVVRDRATGEIMQVGRTCLRDFLGIDDPAWIIQRFRFFRSWTDGDDDGLLGGYGRFEWAHELSYLLAATAACIRIWGWTSKSQAYNDDRLTSTASRLLSMDGTSEYDIEDQRLIKEQMELHGETDQQLTRDVIEWVRGSTESSDYMHNLRLSFTDDLLADPKRLGLAISAVAAYYRVQEREIKRANVARQDAQSEFLGDEGERLRGVKARLETRRGMGDNGWGWTELLKFRTPEGCILCWFTGSADSFDIGQDVVLDGTVKRHNEYKGTKETQLTRVAIKELVAA